MPVSLKSIDIHAFRGIVDIQIPLNGRHLLLCGENGTGKSSVVDGIEFFFTGAISHLEGAQGISSARHGPHVNFHRKDTKVELIFDPGNISMSRTFAAAPVPSTSLKEYFETATSGKFILRRAQILTFITAQPADRFSEIAGIIGVDKLDGIELEMMRARDSLEGQVEGKSREIEVCLTCISGLLGQSVSNTSGILSALNQRLASLSAPGVNSLNEFLHSISKNPLFILKPFQGSYLVDCILQSVLHGT